MNSWWGLEVVSVGGGVEEWFFDEEPGLFRGALYADRVVSYDGTCGGDSRRVFIVIDNCVSWTLDRVEQEEEGQSA